MAQDEGRLSGERTEEYGVNRGVTGAGKGWEEGKWEKMEKWGKMVQDGEMGEEKS